MYCLRPKPIAKCSVRIDPWGSQALVTGKGALQHDLSFRISMLTMLANPFCQSWDLQLKTHENSDKSRPPGIETICTFTFFGKDFTIITQMCLLPLKHCSKVRMIHWLPASNTSPTSTCKNAFKRFICSIQILQGEKKNNLPTVNLDNAARITGSWNRLQPSTPKKQQSIGRMKRSKSFQWRGASGRNYENVGHWELKNPGQGCFSSLALSCCIAGLWQLSLNSTTLWDRRGIELHSPQKVGKRCIQNHSKSFKIIVSKYLPRRFTVCLHSTLQPCRQTVGTPWLPCRMREQIELLIWVDRT